SAAAAGTGLTGAAPSLYRKCAGPIGSSTPSPDEDGCHPAGAGAGRRLRRMNGPRRVAASPARPLLLFDGDCGFCRRWILGGKTVERPTYRIANALFLRLLGLCYLAAFVSLWVQVDGLIGSRGILPVKDLLEAVRAQLGGERWMLFPTLCWLNPSDALLHLL